MSNALTLDNFSRNAVENFVQTVVFVDDKIYASQPKGTVVDEKIAASPKARASLRLCPASDIRARL